MKLLLVLGFIVVGANANIISYPSGSCRNRCGEDSYYTCSCAARCILFIQSTGCCDDYFAYCGVGYPIPPFDPPIPPFDPTYHPPETPEHPTYYPPATEAPTYYPPQRCNNPGPIENGYISSDQHFFNIGGTVNYACKTGYQLKPAESRQRVCTSSYFISFLQTPYWTPEEPICEKILPCEKNPCDTNADCTNIGTDHFNCDCKDGYTGDGETCSQIFPCDSMPCDPNANCTNIGTTHFQCDCLPGYTGTGKECTKINPCDLVVCPPHSTCHNIEDVAVCKCDEGYFQVPGGECIITCPAPELPEHGSYSPAEQSRYILGSNIIYTCDIGYKLVGDEIRRCMSSGEFSGFARCREINPCEDYNPCDPNAVCTNIDNLRYMCDCKDDYVGDGKKCRRIFPCETNPCHSMADCIDVSYTKYTCNCVQGYRGNGKLCEKIDPCENHQCSLCGTCIPNADGLGHTCVCNSGYFGDGKNCKKPCDEHNCHPLATCYPHECGNHSCECNVGYEGSGSFCRPIDPCRLVKCTNHSTCKVISGAPKCICDSRYRPLPGGRCQKIYPCDSDPCGSHTNCINVDEDSFRCDCVQGYFPSGLHSCGFRNCPVPEFPANGQYGPIQRTYPVGSKITYTCADGYRVVGFETHECLESGRFSGFATCEPIPTTPPPPSCKGKCGAYSFGSDCACDPACINHGNCCHDYAQYCSAYVGR